MRTPLHLSFPERRARRSPPPGIWFAIALALGVLLFGVLANHPAASEQIYWGREQARAGARDRLYRDSDTLPVASAAGPARALLAAEAPGVSASYEDRTAAAAHAAVPERPPVPTPATFELVEPPPAYQLTGFRFEYQTANNCGPATLATALSYWGWEGDQATIAAVLKPEKRDKNVRWDELVYYVRTQAGWLDALFRANGDFETLQLFVANGYPVIIETGYYVDNMWVGHYLLVSGYDVEARRVTVQDATGGPNRVMPFEDVDRLWQQFNRLYVVVFPADKSEKVEFMLGGAADEDANRRAALARAEADLEVEPENAFAWFNYGSNLNYFDRYEEAAAALDRAREIGLPWRMLFYQFGPYVAYFNVGRYQDVEDLATATLNARPDLEESFVWRGWARHMLGDTPAAIADFNAALEVNPNFNDAITALEYFGAR